MKTKLHPRNRHKRGYNFQVLAKAYPELSDFVEVNKYGNESIDFFNPEAVRLLNKALLKHNYQIGSWDIPQDYLCPPIPGRADYIHYIADLLTEKNNGNTPKGEKIKGLDIGVGANCIYPIIGRKEYGWSFVGSDIDPVSIENATQIVESNSSLRGKIELRLQSNRQLIFQNIIQPKEHLDFMVCNPPFHASAEAAASGTRRKINNLKGKGNHKAVLNFGGQSNELWCEGGEKQFIQTMIQESRTFANNCFWFTTLVSKSSNLPSYNAALKAIEPTEIKTIEMEQGNKVSRFIAWTFLNEKQQDLWKAERWRS